MQKYTYENAPEEIKKKFPGLAPRVGSELPKNVPQKPAQSPPEEAPREVVLPPKPSLPLTVS
jgi:hypothetical protein